MVTVANLLAWNFTATDLADSHRDERRYKAQLDTQKAKLDVQLQNKSALYSAIGVEQTDDEINSLTDEINSLNKAIKFEIQFRKNAKIMQKGLQLGRIFPGMVIRIRDTHRQRRNPHIPPPPSAASGTS
jgi:hypothetical protein